MALLSSVHPESGRSEIAPRFSQWGHTSNLTHSGPSMRLLKTATSAWSLYTSLVYVYYSRQCFCGCTLLLLSWQKKELNFRNCDWKKLLFACCLTSQQHASVSQGRICSHNFTCCHTEIQVAHQTFHLTQSQYTDTGPTSPSTDPLTPGAWQGSHWSANFEVTGMTRPRKNPGASGIRTRSLPLSRRTT